MAVIIMTTVVAATEKDISIILGSKHHAREQPAPAELSTTNAVGVLRPRRVLMPQRPRTISQANVQ